MMATKPISWQDRLVGATLLGVPEPPKSKPRPAKVTPTIKRVEKARELLRRRLCRNEVCRATGLTRQVVSVLIHEEKGKR